jgi:hypothetical protein
MEHPDEIGSCGTFELERLIEQGPQTLPTLQLHRSPKTPTAYRNTAYPAKPDVVDAYLIDFKCRSNAEPGTVDGGFSQRIPALRA